MSGSSKSIGQNDHVMEDKFAKKAVSFKNEELKPLKDAKSDLGDF